MGRARKEVEPMFYFLFFLALGTAFSIWNLERRVKYLETELWKEIQDLRRRIKGTAGDY